MAERFYAGVDGGGTRTTLVIVDEAGRERSRRAGPAGLVDPRDPRASAEVVAALVREGMAEAGLAAPLAALCAGLAGVGNAAEREAVERALSNSGVASRVRVATDGEIALEGSLGGGAGVLLIAGTGSVAYGRGEDGRTDRCGGWGMVVGDEGSGYAIGRGGLAAALRAVDGREEETRLLPLILERLELEGPREIPPWAGRVTKAEIAALAAHVLRAAAEGDAVALRVVAAEARALAHHAGALRRRLAPWRAETPVVFHGGVLNSPLYASLVTEGLRDEGDFRVAEPVSDAVDGAIRFARVLAES